MTANAVTSLSLHPPLILIVVDKRNTMYDHLKQAGCFAVNLLTADQEAISRRFAAPGPSLSYRAQSDPTAVDWSDNSKGVYRFDCFNYFSCQFC